MGTLFLQEVELFKKFALEISQSKNFERTALIEVGFGTAELFSKVDTHYDMLIGVELSQSMIDCALYIHPQFKEEKTNVKLLQGNAMELNNVI